ncbi:hypothetical protein, partial [Anaplasma phagocytophilum]|uniref:hypothetical protein n=1 Tax=Anaplasma phagocytophilum TaxID=948 RepID=UPI00201B3232
CECKVRQVFRKSVTPLSVEQDVLICSVSQLPSSKFPGFWDENNSYTTLRLPFIYIPTKYVS